MKLKDFVPPVVKKLMKRSRQRHTLYSSYEDARAVCRDSYEDNNLVDVVYEKTRLYRDSLLSQRPFVSDLASLRPLIGLSLPIRNNELRVIDFGGACGAHYFLAKAFLGKRITLRWHVVETPKMASRAAGLEDGQLKFFDDLPKARKGLDHVDLVFSSGALQYVPRPYQLLEQLTDCGAVNIFISRVGLSSLGKELVIVQKTNLSANGLGPMPEGMRDGVVEYPVTFARKEKFEKILSRNYSIDILFDEDKGAYQAGDHSIDVYGYFGSIKSDA